MSQEYTPVDWVDETTSQQGTLINAERLDQMQTAHHYADGFEEVDAIPTEDPGVDYHKIVYCTADTTFYRWDGTQWTADIDEDTKRLLDQEIARATAAEGELAQDIEDEATARAQADTALQGNITAEATARASADTALGARIDEEAQFREDADRQIATQIGALNGQVIPLNPGSSTPTIQNAIAANEGNISNLTSEVDGLTQGLAQEVTDRENADTQLAADITAEVQARAAAIASLQAGVYTKTEADNLLAAKADKATTLAGYGITDAVTLGTAQEITASKTFNGAVYFDGRFELKQDNPYAHIVNSGYTKGTAPSSNKLSHIRFEDSAGSIMGSISHTIYNDGDGALRLATSNAADNNTGELLIGATAGGQHFVRASYRDYAPANTGDVVTIGTLDAYPPMVRTTGAQTILGSKIFEYVGGKTAMHQRITGTSKIEVFRYTISAGSAINTNIFIHGMSRGVGIDGQLTIQYDGASSLALSFDGSKIFGSAGNTAMYAYLDGTSVVVALGNQTSGNNYMALSIAGAYSAAGLEQSLDFSYLGTYRTDMITDQTARYIWGA